MTTYLILSFIGVILFLSLSNWLTHLSMTKKESAARGWGTYKKFKREFNKYDWEPLRHYPKSYQANDTKCYYHASIIKFDGKGMLIKDPISYLLVKRYVKKKFEQEKVIW